MLSISFRIQTEPITDAIQYPASEMRKALILTCAFSGLRKGLPPSIPMSHLERINGARSLAAMRPAIRTPR